MSSSVGAPMASPKLPVPVEDENEVDESLAEGPTILEIAPTPLKSTDVTHISLDQVTSAVVSPTRSKKGSLPSALTSTRDMAVQTEAAELPPTPIPLSMRSDFQQYQSSLLSSDAASESDHHGTDSSHRLTPLSAEAALNRTASLSTLVEHVAKILTRIKSADVASLELRLKRQNLPVDVSHLAKSTLRDIVSETVHVRSSELIQTLAQ